MQVDIESEVTARIILMIGNLQRKCQEGSGFAMSLGFFCRATGGRV
jgi:hypothetical protein